MADINKIIGVAATAITKVSGVAISGIAKVINQVVVLFTNTQAASKSITMFGTNGTLTRHKCNGSRVGSVR